MAWDIEGEGRDGRTGGEALGDLDGEDAFALTGVGEENAEFALEPEFAEELARNGAGGGFGKPLSGGLYVEGVPSVILQIDGGFWRNGLIVFGTVFGFAWAIIVVHEVDQGEADGGHYFVIGAEVGAFEKDVAELAGDAENGRF